MNCEQLAACLTDLMDGELESDVEGAALEHLGSCHKCEQVLAETRDVVELAQSHGRPSLDDDDRSRMLKSIVSELSTSTGN